MRRLSLKAAAELLTTDDTDYTDNGSIGFVCIRAICVIRG
jgi:DeoR/GlpR family transcriptional regulator of sugar metabolism